METRAAIRWATSPPPASCICRTWRSWAWEISSRWRTLAPWIGPSRRSGNAPWHRRAKTPPLATGRWSAFISPNLFHSFRTDFRLSSCGNLSLASVAERSATAPPPRGMLLDQLQDRKVEVFSIGKIFDVFLGRGIGEYEKTKNNTDGMAKTLAALDELSSGLLFVNLVDFDQLYGHRNDVEGYANALDEFDAWLPSLYQKLSARDLLIVTADHGCDPTTPSTDHSREYVPLLVYRPRQPEPFDLGVRSTLSDIGQTVAENFGAKINEGTSFLQSLS